MVVSDDEGTSLTGRKKSILTELLGDQLLEHTIKDGVQSNSFMATSKLDGKTIGLYFS
jgi:hypothetical protein